MISSLKMRMKNFIASFLMQDIQSTQKETQEMEAEFACVIPLEKHAHKYEVVATLHGRYIILYQGNDADASFEAFDRGHKKYNTLRWSIEHEG